MHHQKTEGRENPENTSQPRAAQAGAAPSEPVIRQGRMRPGLSANDGQADDFLALAEGWDCGNGETVFTQGLTSQPIPMFDGIAQHCSAGQIRQLGSCLLKLADSLGNNWHPDQVRSNYHWLNDAGRIERQALRLAQVGIRMRDAGRRRLRHLSAEWFGEPAWEMLLELFIQFAGGARVSTKSLAIASGAPDTTALRIMDRLEAASLIERSPSQADKRVTLVSLTREGVVAVGSVLMEVEG